MPMSMYKTKKRKENSLLSAADTHIEKCHEADFSSMFLTPAPYKADVEGDSQSDFSLQISKAYH